jgi:hypothetical protein
MILIGAFGLFWFGKSPPSSFLCLCTVSVFRAGPVFRECKVVPSRKEGASEELAFWLCLTAVVNEKPKPRTLPSQGQGPKRAVVAVVVAEPEEGGTSG